MKLRKLVIQNFRAIEQHTIDFTDEFGEVRDVFLIVGPNGSGKTSILDAIWFGLMAQMSYRVQRSNFRHEAEYVVKQGKHYAKVKFTIEISEKERQQIESWKKQLVELNAMAYHPGPNERISDIVWTYPAQPGFKDEAQYDGYGGYHYKNEYDWEVLQGRNYYNRLRKLSASRVSGQELAGGIYFFEQERKIKSSFVREIAVSAADNSDDVATLSKIINIRELLINFGLKDKVRRFEPTDSWYQKIREAYNSICAPHQMGEVYAPASSEEYKIDFRDGEGNGYGFDGLSSGERSVLNFLVHYVYKHMYNSIVLIDELEMHLHPTWQRRLIDSLRNFNDGNQFIITTHSPTLEQSVLSDNVLQLGKLDIPEWQYEAITNNENDT